MKPYSEQDVYIAEMIYHLARNFRDGSRGIVGVGCNYRTGIDTVEVLLFDGVKPESGDLILRGLELMGKVEPITTVSTMALPHEIVRVIEQIEAESLSEIVWVGRERDMLWLKKREGKLGVEYERLAHFARALGGTYEPGKGGGVMPYQHRANEELDWSQDKNGTFYATFKVTGRMIGSVTKHPGGGYSAGLWHGDEWPLQVLTFPNFDEACKWIRERYETYRYPDPELLRIFEKLGIPVQKPESGD